VFIKDAMGPTAIPLRRSGLEEIVVTATRRTERLQDVSRQCDGIFPRKTRCQGLRSIDDLTRLTPGVTFQRDATTSSGNFNDEDSDINIRGVDSTAGTSTVASTSTIRRFRAAIFPSRRSMHFRPCSI